MRQETGRQYWPRLGALPSGSEADVAEADGRDGPVGAAHLVDHVQRVEGEVAARRQPWDAPAAGGDCGDDEEDVDKDDDGGLSVSLNDKQDRGI